MGQCGCGDFFATHKLPGPNGTLYAFDVYPGCTSCHNPVGMVVYRFFDPKEAARWDVSRLPDLPFQKLHGEDYEGQHSFIPIYDPEKLIRDLWEAQADPSVAVMRANKKLAAALPDGEDFARLVRENLDETQEEARRRGFACMVRGRTLGDRINQRARAGAGRVDAEEALARMKKDDPRRPEAVARLEQARETERAAMEAERRALGGVA